MKKVICGSCHYTFDVVDSAVSRVYFPNRMIYINSSYIGCLSCNKTNDLVFFGENFIDISYLGNEVINQNNLLAMQKMIDAPDTIPNKLWYHNYNEHLTNREYWQRRIEDYKETLKNYKAYNL